MSGTRYRPNTAEVAGETIDDEVILVHLERGHYYNLRGSGLAIWKGVEDGLSEDEIAHDLVRRFDGDAVEIQRGVAELLSALLAEGILLVDDGPPAARPREPRGDGGPAERVPYRPPALGKHTDMEDLLTIDPIHDVDETGWPNARPR